MQTSRNELRTVGGLPISVWRDFRGAWGALVVYEVLFKLFEAWLFVPAVALLLSALLSQAGHVAVTNRDILDFLLTASGLFYVALFGTVAAALLLVEQAGIMALVALTETIERPPVRQVIVAAFVKTLRVAELGVIKLAVLALASVPFALLALLIYGIFLSQHDINYYLADRPPNFWLAASFGVVLLLAALAVLVWLYVRWAFALPILLFERQPVRAALRTSRDRVRGVGWRVGFYLVAWPLVALLLGVALESGFRFLATALLENAGERPIALMLLLLAAQGGLLALVSSVAVVGQGLVVRRLYLIRSEQLGLFRVERLEATGSATPANLWLRRLAYLLFLLAPLGLWRDLWRSAADRPPVRVTAHRGHSRAAPENTLSAVAKAIESGADYAEIDVQQTADGVTVLVHDSDLKRVAGVPRRITELHSEEARKLDVGSWFGPSFAGEHIPTLEEVVDLSRGRIKLNIELKFYDSDRQLARDVARLVHEHGIEDDCLITSFNYDALLEVRLQNPRLRTGLIIAQTLGDASGLDVEVLNVRAAALSGELLRAGHRAGKEIHVWTVNDPRQMSQMIQRGVDNILTDDPDTLIQVRDQWASMTRTERLLLASRLLLGLGWDEPH